MVNKSGKNLEDTVFFLIEWQLQNARTTHYPTKITLGCVLVFLKVWSEFRLGLK